MTFGRLLRGGWAVAAVAAVLALDATPAGATWSLVGVDSTTGAVGVAVASCVPVDALGPGDQPLLPVVVVPGKAAAVVQGGIDANVPARAGELLAAGATPDQVVGDLVGAADDPVVESRQLAVVAVDGATAAFSGRELGASAGDRQGSGVSVQGNQVTGPEVVEAALAAYERSRLGGADLGTALVDGLVAGSEAGGDRRCPDQTALFAHLAVAGSGGGTDVLTVSVDPGDGQNPVSLLADARRRGTTGFVDAGRARAGGGLAVLIGALMVGAGLAAAGAFAWWRGIGSVRRRRTGSGRV